MIQLQYHRAKTEPIDDSSPLLLLGSFVQLIDSCDIVARTMKSTGIYLTFDGNCAEAFAHYSTIFQKKLTSSMTNGASPMKDKIPPEFHDKMLHCSLDVGLGETFAVMGCDRNPSMHAATQLVVGTNTQICLTTSTKDETERLFTELSQDGTVIMPLASQFWGSYFGSLVDKFGIHWMFDFPLASNGDAQENKHVLENESDPDEPEAKKTKN